MSTLQISLAVVGVILLGLIVAYNAWNHRRNAPKRAQPLEGERGATEAHARFDPALDGVDVTNLPPSAAAMHDPLLDAAPSQELHAQAGHEAAVPEAHPGAEVSAADLTGEMQPGVRTMPLTERKLALDGLIDAIAPIRVDHPVTGDAALLVQPTTRRAGSKPFRIEGLNESTGEWETVRAGQRYTAFQAGVQLANRLGALNEIEFSEFVAKVQNFADGLNAIVELPDMLHEVGRARELDQFASEHDAQLSFVLRPRRAAWSPGYIEQHAANLGFVPAAMPGRMLLPSAAGLQPALLTLAYDPQAAQSDNLDQTAVHELWLSLDVPQVARSEEPFARLREVIHVLCENMDGFVCDQNGYQLLPQVFDPIDADLQKLYDRLDQRELSAGSMLARRMFN
ncbi:cell division protein FtsZ [Comamonas sp.]